MKAPDPLWPQKLLKLFHNSNVIFSHDLPWHPSRTVAPHAHPCFQLDYFYEGAGRVVANGEKFDVAPGDLYLANPGDVHEFEAAPDNPMQGITFKFRLKKSTPALRLPNFLGNLSVLPHSQQRELQELLRRACTETNSNRAGHEELAASFLAIFFVLIVRYLEDRRRLLAQNAEVNTSKAVMDYIKRSYHMPLTLTDLGRVAGLHPRYLCQKFSEEMGLSPIAALTRERMEVARNLLANTRLPITEVGTQVGYSDIYHFSKRFKSTVGMSPRQFRGKNQFLSPAKAQKVTTSPRRRRVRREQI